MRCLDTTSPPQLSSPSPSSSAPAKKPRPVAVVVAAVRRPPPPVRRPAAARRRQSLPQQPQAGLGPGRFSPASPRPPLRVRDANRQHDAPALTTTPPAAAAAKKMPVDDRPPRPPQLAARSAAAAATRSPLTPKVAAKPVRRPPSVVQPARDDASSGHVTPRSGPRQGRVNALASTPVAAPDRLAAGSPADPQGDGNKFFYASDAKTIQRPHSVPHKPVAFLYANGASAEPKRTTSPHFTPVLAPAHESAAAKFVYANGAPGAGPAKHALGASAPASALSTASRLPPVRLAPGGSAAACQRPTSPVKTTPPPAGSSLSAAPLLAASPGQSPYTQSSPALTSAPPQGKPRASADTGKPRVSVDTTPRLVRPGHSRTGSASTVASRFAVSPATPQAASPPQSPGLPHPVTAAASLAPAAEGPQEREAERGAAAQAELSQSPARSSQGPSEPASELVANARRERKVQDLEITNASLAAINRTLERQLRKQTIELRRLRRMSRAGHMSLLSAATDPAGVDAGDDDDDELDDSLDSLDESDLSGADSPNDKLAAPTARPYAAPGAARRQPENEPEPQALPRLDRGAHQAGPEGARLPRARVRRRVWRPLPLAHRRQRRRRSCRRRRR